MFRESRSSVWRVLSSLGLAVFLLNACAVDTSDDTDAIEEVDDATPAGGVCEDLCLHPDAPADLDVDACFSGCEENLEQDEYRAIDPAACNNDWRCLCKIYGCHTYS